MKNIRVTYHNEATINMNNFENLKPGYTLEADVEPDKGETSDEVRAKLRAKVDRWLDEEVQEIRDGIK